MNKIIFSSKTLLSTLNKIKEKEGEMYISNPFRLIAKDGEINFSSYKTDQHITEIYCEPKHNFDVPIYKSTADRLIKILQLLEDQPITISFDDSETFNVKIHECIV